MDRMDKGFIVDCVFAMILGAMVFYQIASGIYSLLHHKTIDFFADFIIAGAFFGELIYFVAKSSD